MYIYNIQVDEVGCDDLCLCVYICRKRIAVEMYKLRERERLRRAKDEREQKNEGA